MDVPPVDSGCHATTSTQQQAMERKTIKPSSYFSDEDASDQYNTIMLHMWHVVSNTYMGGEQRLMATLQTVRGYDYEVIWTCYVYT